MRLQRVRASHLTQHIHNFFTQLAAARVHQVDKATIPTRGCAHSHLFTQRLILIEQNVSFNARTSIGNAPTQATNRLHKNNTRKNNNRQKAMARGWSWLVPSDAYLIECRKGTHTSPEITRCLQQSHAIFIFLVLQLPFRLASLACILNLPKGGVHFAKSRALRPPLAMMPILLFNSVEVSE